jgi:hypothetical protein
MSISLKLIGKCIYGNLRVYLAVFAVAGYCLAVLLFLCKIALFMANCAVYVKTGKEATALLENVDAVYRTNVPKT